MKGVMLFFLLFASVAQAAYRVHQLKLHGHDRTGKPTGKTLVVLTTLDPYQYETAQGRYRWLTVELLDTWYCPGDTRYFRPFCQKVKVRGRVPNALDRDPKRTLDYYRQPVIP